MGGGGAHLCLNSNWSQMPDKSIKQKCIKQLKCRWIMYIYIPVNIIGCFTAGTGSPPEPDFPLGLIPFYQLMHISYISSL